MGAYPVFASYAQADRKNDSRKYLEKFVKELREQVAGQTGRPEALSLVFFDRDGLEAGDV